MLALLSGLVAEVSLRFSGFELLLWFTLLAIVGLVLASCIRICGRRDTQFKIALVPQHSQRDDEPHGLWSSMIRQLTESGELPY
jgi:hypothetical protein